MAPGHLLLMSLQPGLKAPPTDLAKHQRTINKDFTLVRERAKNVWVRLFTVATERLLVSSLHPIRSPLT